MRLIDADALVDALSVDPIGCAGCPEPEFMDELIDILDTAPTVKAMVITCDHCINWMSRDDINGVCTLVNISTAGDTTCEYAEEEGEDDD